MTLHGVSIGRAAAGLALGLGLASWLGAQPSARPASAGQAEDTADVLAFTHGDGARMTVPVSISGQGPYAFLVDTGAERTVISRELASRLALIPGDQVTVHSMTETGLVSTARIPELKVSKNSMKDLQAPAFAAADLGAAGMLGVDSLQSQRVVFDFARKTMSIRASRRWDNDRDPNTIVVSARSLYGRLLITQASVDGEKIVVVLDTGSQITIGNGALRRKLAARNKLRATQPVELISVTGGMTLVDYTAVKRMAIGGVDIRNMPIGFADVQPFRQLHLEDRPALLLGMDALKLFDRVSVDFARKEVRFLSPDLSAGAVAIRMAGRMTGAVAPPS
ncbi:MAG: hypothetical protein JWN69_2070 [Alphaproteobacteria bacterium]|nr:hypothetical protein [Alphaproteobacteria bacterium]